MLGIKINNEYLDLSADISLELERNNPFLNTDQILGEYSLGITLRYSEKNYRILNYAGNWTKKHNKITADAQLYDKGLFRYAGKLVINQHSSNINRIEETNWTGFFTMGAASYFQTIQDVRLQDINLGGMRQFAWTGYSGGGFWGHIGQALVPRAFPYTFYPIENKGYAPEHGVVFINRYSSTGYLNVPSGDVNMENSNALTIIPHIYLDYIIKQALAKDGWTLAGDVATDPGFLAATMVSLKAIYWIDFHKVGPLYVYSNPHSSVYFDLADHVPQDVTIGSLFTNLKTRFGWYFDFDSNTKTAYLRSNKSLIGATAKDWTKYVQSLHTVDYADDAKIFSLINNIDSEDTYPLLPQIDWLTVTNVASVAALPTAAAGNAQQIIYCFLENNLYQSRDDGSGYQWYLYASNVGDYEPTGHNDIIESDISTLPLEKLQYRPGQYGLFPAMFQRGSGDGSQGLPTWGMRILFYHGMQPDNLGSNYPYASPTNVNTAGTVLPIPWAIPYKHQYNTTNDGTFDYWWRQWLKLLSIQDFRTVTFHLPITELKNFTFNDTIVVNNVFFLVQTLKEVIPFNGIVEAKLKRIY